MLKEVVVMGKKEKKKMSKKAKIILFSILGAVFAAVAVVFFVYVLPVIKLFSAISFIDKDTPVKPVSTTLTSEQKTKDLDYMYDIVCLNNPARSQIEEAYGISYDEIYNTYRDLVANSGSEFEFYSELSCFLAVLPGEHNGMFLPDYADIMTGGHDLVELCGNQKIKNYTYAWNEEFRDDVAGYLEYSFIGFAYVDGKYVGKVFTTDKIKQVRDYAGGVLVSIDGRDPEDMCFELFETNDPFYDSGNDCFFRSALYFNDGTGVKHTAEILMPDGTVVTTDIYDDPAYDTAFSAAIYLYPDLLGFKSSSDSSGASSGASDSGNAESAPSTYTITSDPERKLVYIDLTSCQTYEGNRLVSDMNRAVEDAGADTLILDIRSNAGGIANFATTQLLPALFTHDVDYVSHVYGMRNKHTRHFYGNTVYKTMKGIDTRLEGDYFYYDEDLSVTGNAAHDLKIYILTSQQTFSTADIIVRICKEYENCTVIGTNTGGEGICGDIFQCYLPESRFVFCYPPTVNIDSVEDSYLGTEPDIYMHYTLEEYNARNSLAAEGLDVDSYEVRQMWDQTLNKAIEMAEAE